MITRKEDMIYALECLVETLKKAEKIDRFGFDVLNEMEEILLEHSNDMIIRRPTGWINISLNIRYLIKVTESMSSLS